MEYRIEWNGGIEDVLVTTTGEADVDVLDEMVEELLADPRYRDGLKILLDHRACRWIGLSVDDIRRRAELQRAKRSRIGYQHIAFVVGSPEEYGMGRMLAAHLDRQVGFVARAFQSLEEARAWLALGGGAPADVTP